MNSRPESPFGAASMVELSQLDLRYEGCRLNRPRPKDGFWLRWPKVGSRSRSRASSLPPCGSCSMASSACAAPTSSTFTPGPLSRWPPTRPRALCVCCARPMTTRSLCSSRLAAWVSLRLGVLAELSPVVREALFDGSFPVYSYLYSLRPFRRLNGAPAVDEFVTALRGKKLSARQIEQLAHGFFRGPESFRAEIRQGHLTLPLQQFKDLPDDPDGCSEFERLFLADLEQAQKVLVRVMTKSEDPRLSSRPYRAQAHLLCAGLLSRLPAFTKTLKQIHDHSGQT